MKIVVIDDDPTGSQTVHSCPLLFQWDIDTLRRGLIHSSPLLFLLANTRSLSTESAKQRNLEITFALDEALRAEGLDRSDVLLVSRGDSTLRGHGVVEPQTLQNSFGPFDATLHIPAFLEGGRTTVNGVHLLHGQPVHTTSFARDSFFRYSSSDLAEWLQEKSFGEIRSCSVERITGNDFNSSCLNGCSQLIERMRSFKDNVSVVVDAEHQSQLVELSAAVKALWGKKRFLFRSAASFVKALADLDQQPLDSNALAGLRRIDGNGVVLPGLVLVGSHVRLADLQLERLLIENKCKGIQLPVRKIARVLDGSNSQLLLSDLERVWSEQLLVTLEKGLTPVLFSSRGELNFSEQTEGLSFSINLAKLMARLVSCVAPKLGYIISKGGLTTQMLLSYGLSLKSVQLEGQILPGLSMVRPPNSNPYFNLPILTFPGNLGEPETLQIVWQKMEAG